MRRVEGAGLRGERPSPCQRARPRPGGEHLADAEADNESSPRSLVYFYDAEMLTYHRTKSHPRRREPHKTVTIARKALAAADPVVHPRSRGSEAVPREGLSRRRGSRRGRRRDGASRRLGLAKPLARVARGVRATPATMEPWRQRPSVKTLDDPTRHLRAELRALPVPTRTRTNRGDARTRGGGRLRAATR